MRTALAELDWGRVLRLVIARTGLSQAEIAHLTGFSQPHVSRLVKGLAQCYDMRAIIRMADGLGVPRALAGLASEHDRAGDSVVEDLEEVNPTRRRAFLVAAVSVPAAAILARDGHTRGVAYSEAIGIRELLPRLYEIDDLGGSDDRGLTRWCLGEVEALLGHAEFSEATGRELQVAHGELAEAVGWLEFDAGNCHTARYYLGEAMTSAHLAGDLRLEVLILASMIMVARQSGRPREAIQLAHLAQRRAAGWGTQRLMSLLAAREAVSWAQAGDARASNAAMDRAANLFTSTADHDDPSWLAFYTVAELSALRSSASSFLGRHDLAVEQRRESLRTLGKPYVRNRALYTARLALAHLAEGDERGAIHALAPQLELFTQVTSRRATADLHECLTLLGRSKATDSRDLVDRATELNLARAA